MANDIDLAKACTLLPPRPEDAHKGTFGHVFVVGGARGYTGAVVMAALAAARSGAGLVTVGVPRPLGDVVASHLVVAMSRLLEATPAESIARKALDEALAFAEGKDAVVLGPGMSRDPDTQAFILEFVRQCPAPLLVDADGLNGLATDVDALERARAPIVITPHPGEMARLIDGTVEDVQRDRIRTALDFSQRYGCTVVLKGHRTVVAGEGEAAINTSGNSGLATGGSGDVLSGLVGGLMAQGLKPLDASRLGVYTHGLAGDIAAAEKTGRGLIATDVLDALPAAWARMERSTTP